MNSNLFKISSLITVFIFVSTFGIAQYSGGSGTVADPYQIGNIADLDSLSRRSQDWGKHFKQTANIDASSTTEWNNGIGFSPIGSEVKNFSGTYDGQGFKINELTINFGVYTGFFGITGNTSKISNCIISGNFNSYYYPVGCLIGRNSGTVENCHTNGKIWGNGPLGGLIGDNIGGNVTNCSFKGKIIGSGYIGGLIGLNHGNVTNCNFNGSVIGSSDCIGGLIGTCYKGRITNCSSTGFVKGEGNVGGLIGLFSGGIEESSISNCFSNVSTSGIHLVGGLVGEFGGEYIKNCYSMGPTSGSTMVGGAFGYLTGSISISNCYASGLVTGNNSSGGLIGSQVGGLLIENCFWDIETTGKSNSASGTGKTTSQMKTQSTFTSNGWDFIGETANGNENIWMISDKCPAKGYPIFSWQSTTDDPIVITSTNTGSRCGAGTVNLSASSNLGSINWYNSLTGDTLLASGTSFYSPSISYTTTYYAESVFGNCISSPRIPVIATIKQTTGSSQTDTTCSNTYFWAENGETYLTSGIYTTVLTNAIGCDSIITLNLTIKGSTTTISKTACSNYTWSENGQTYDTSGTYIKTYTNTAGCDSMIMLNLTIAKATATKNENNTITSSKGYAYRWIDCATLLPAYNLVWTEQTLFPDENGSYAVIVYMEANCTDTSDCVEISTIGIVEPEDNSISIFPNPTRNSVTITFEGIHSEINILDAQGKLLHTQHIISGESISVEAYENGFYFLQLKTLDGTTLTERIVKN